MSEIKQYKYNSYDEYKFEQIKANKSKLDASWVQKKDILYLSEYIKNNNINYNNIICHGTRQGLEQKYFREFLKDIDLIIGTEISDTAIKFKDTICHDFHEIKEEWVNNFDILYSNSWDHSFDPFKSLNNWIKSVKSNGILIIEWSIQCENVKISDPFGASFDVYKNIFSKHQEINIIDILNLDSEQFINNKLNPINKKFFILKKI